MISKSPDTSRGTCGSLMGAPDDYDCGDTVICPNCGREGFVFVSNIGKWKCRDCGYEDYYYDSTEVIDGKLKNDISFLSEEFFSDLGGMFSDGDEVSEEDFSIVRSIKDLA